MDAHAARRRGGRGVVALVVLVSGLGIAAGQMYPVPPSPIPPPAPTPPSQPADPAAPSKRPPIVVSSAGDGLLILPASASGPAVAPAPLPPGVPAYLPAVPSVPTAPVAPVAPVAPSASAAVPPVPVSAPLLPAAPGGALPPIPPLPAAPVVTIPPAPVLPAAPPAPAAPVVTIPPAPVQPAVPPITPPVAPPVSPAQLPTLQIPLAPPLVAQPPEPPQVVATQRETPTQPVVSIPPIPVATPTAPPMPLVPPVPGPNVLHQPQTLPQSDPLPPPEVPGVTGPSLPSHSPAPVQWCPPPRTRHKGLVDSLHQNDNYGLKSLFDSLHPADSKGKNWYDKLNIGGYAQIRFGRTVDDDPLGANPFMTTDRAITGNAEDFFIRRARLVLSGDVSDHLYFYFQQEFAITLPGTINPNFGQIRDLYGDVYIDKTKIHRLRVGLSKVPYAFDNMQSSQNRVPLDRSDAMNSATSFVERDLGVFYYWTPVEKQKLLKELVSGGLKGSGNYGIFAFGVYNGQGLSFTEQNRNLYIVSRLTWPVQLANGQVVEASIQGYTGENVVEGAPIRPLGAGPSTIPAGTRQEGDQRGWRDQRVAGTFVWYPQPFGIQAEWEYGEGPGLNDAQTAVGVRALNGGYVALMYKLDTARCGIVTPYARYQYYRGGYKGFANTPYGSRDEWNLGFEWQIRREMELTLEYAMVNGLNLSAIDKDGARSYGNFDGGVLRAQFQVNY